MISGNSVKIALGYESTYGTKVAPTKAFEITSESFGYSANKTSEGLLTGAIGASKVETMGVKAEGSVSTLAKPETVGYWLKGALGECTTEADTEDDEYYVHTFKPVGNAESDDIPSFTFVVDRKAKVFAYAGMKINQLAFKASSGDRLSLDVDFVGKLEESGTMPTGLTAENAKTFKFHQATLTLDDEEVADITSIGITYNNNLDSDTQTTSTGLYYKEPTPGMREITIDLEALYSSALEDVRDDYWKTDDVFGIKVEFVDDDENKLTFTIPACQINSMSNATATGSDTMKQSLTCNAVSSSDDLIKVELRNKKESY